MTSTSPRRVVIAGGGIGGLEAMLALRSLAGDRVAITLLEPDPTFHVRALSVEDPFARGVIHSYDIARLCAEAGAELVADTLERVDAEGRAVLTTGGRELPYDDLVLAIGARRRAPYATGLVFRGLEDAEGVHGLVQDMELGYVDAVAFVVPTGAATWPLPLYELALLMAGRAYEMGVAPELTFITPEERPLGAFGIEAAETVRDVLAEAGIALRTETHVRALDHGVPLGMDGEPIVRARRAVTIPLLEGPRVPGVPADPGGFVPVDDRGAVLGLPGVWAVGDATTFPLKQGGVAAQHAVTVAASIAGTDAAVARPTLRAKLLTGGRPVHLGEVGGDADAKVATTYLGPALARLDQVAV